MKKSVIFLLSSVLAFLVLLFAMHKSITHESGAPSGTTGAPIDGMTCATAGCHPGYPVAVNGWISSTIPVEGYYPDSVYEILLTAKRVGAPRFGFEICATDENNDYTGTLIIANPSETQIGFQGKYITHKLAGTYGLNGKKSWTVRWKAPATPFSVTFYAAFVAGENQNDSTYLCSRTYYSIYHGIREKMIGKISLFPNPVSDVCWLDLHDYIGQFMLLRLYSVQGKLMYEKEIDKSSQGLININVSGFSPGWYMLEISNKDVKLYTKLVIVRNLR